jgi:hypothetical protein
MSAVWNAVMVCVVVVTALLRDGCSSSLAVEPDDVALKADASPFPFAKPSTTELRSSPRKVFAHYFIPFPVSIDNADPSGDYYAYHYLRPEGENNKFTKSGGFIRQRPLPRPPRPEKEWSRLDLESEVRLAIEAGIDGFSCDILGTGDFLKRVVKLMDAATKVDPGFSIMIMPDMEAEFKEHPERMVSAVVALADHPAACRLPDGRVVLAPYNAQRQTPAWWQERLAELEQAGVRTAFLPLFQGWGKFAADYAPISYGFSEWGMRTPAGAEAQRAWPAKAHKYVGVWMMPVAPQDARPKDLIYWEALNSTTYRSLWGAAIDGGADWVQVVTWNDYSEASEIAPSSSTQYAFYDLTAYYTAWFKTGQPPQVTRDAILYFHRIQPMAALPTDSRQEKPFKCVDSQPRDEIEAVAFLTTPATIEIEVAGEKKEIKADAGLATFSVPLKPGDPLFRIIRGGVVALELQGQWPITASSLFQDPVYHAGGSNRPFVPLPPFRAPKEQAK